MTSRLAKVVLSSKQKGTCRIIPVMITVAVLGHLAYRTLGRIMTGYCIRRLRISAVLITWGNYNHRVIYDEVKNTAAQTVGLHVLPLHLWVWH